MKQSDEPRKFKKQERDWMDRHVSDEYVKKAKLMAYRSRASFKLMEIDDKVKLLRKGMRVIDVGAAPGGWSQVIAERVESKTGKESVVAVDLLSMLPVDGVHFVQGNIEHEDVQEKISEKLGFEKADMVCSDAVPDFVGDRFVDHMNAVYLNKAILTLCG
jgi:23S rRNA (uridine2552-2'-O)-methyltransferase